MKFDSQSLNANQRLAAYRARLSQGLAANPRAEKISAWLQQYRTAILPLFNAALSFERSIYFDLSLPDSRRPDQVADFVADINQRLQETGADIGIGRYAENRHCYQSEVFHNDREARTFHIGVDLFVPPLTKLHAPLAGTVHGFQDNNNPLDYGPTIILQHNPGADLSFYSLYGHLSKNSLKELHIGKAISAGEIFGNVGDYPDNGNWPPHVHVQLISDMLDMVGDFPGVVSPADAALWLQLCPDPKWLLGLPEQSADNTFTLKNELKQKI